MSATAGGPEPPTSFGRHDQRATVSAMPERLIACLLLALLAGCTPLSLPQSFVPSVSRTARPTSSIATPSESPKAVPSPTPTPAATPSPSPSADENGLEV